MSNDTSKSTKRQFDNLDGLPIAMFMATHGVEYRLVVPTVNTRYLESILQYPEFEISIIHDGQSFDLYIYQDGITVQGIDGVKHPSLIDALDNANFSVDMLRNQKRVLGAK